MNSLAMKSLAKNGPAINSVTTNGVAVSKESTTLLKYLNEQREHVLGILEGLPEEALHRPVLPTGWSCLGLVRHLTVDVEQLWFRAVTAGEPFEPGVAGWQVGPDEQAQAVLDAHRREIELANAIIAVTPLDAAPAWWPEDEFGDWRLHDLRELMMHVITETACHAGHLDAARELIDGQTWLIL